MDNAEAEWMALWLSCDLVAPTEAYERVERDLAAIRLLHSALDPPLRGLFRTYWSPSVLSVHLNNEAVGRYLEGTYTDLDELNRKFRIDWVNDNHVDAQIGGGVLTLHFNGRLHPARLAEFYQKVPSLDWVDTAYRGGDGDRIYPWFANGKMTYLFREGQGDCPLGCYMNRYWYFRTDDDGTVEYVGSYTDWEDEHEPNWWPEAKRNRHEFLYGGRA